MKKKILLTTIFTFILIAAGYQISKAATYETDTFKINMPNSFYTEKGQYQVQSVNDDNSIAYNVESTKKGEFENNGVIIGQDFLNGIEQELREQFNSDFVLISKSLIETNGVQGVEVKFRNIETNRYIYVDVYYHISDNYLYSIAIAAYDNRYLSSSEKNSVINSFKVKDTVAYAKGLPFTDIKKTDWYYNSVKYVSDNKMIYGINDYTFNPNGKLTRGMLVTILWRMEGSPTVTGSTYPDVKENQYYYNAIKWASSKKIVNGYKEGKFKPNNYITREQLATILMNYANYKKKDVTARVNLNKFADNTGISSYAKDSVSWAVAKKVISGKSNGTRVDPQGTATRAEAAAMLANYCNYVGR